MITPKEMSRLEKSSKIPVKELMNNAGKGVYEELKKRFNLKNKNIVIISGSGNNGGDGFATTHYLRKEANVKIIFLGKEENLSDEARFYYNKVKDLIQNDITLVNEANIVIDAMLGTGVKGKIKEPINSAIDTINKSKAFKISIDIPTGLNPETGEVIDKIVDTDLIIALHDIKPGLDKFIDKVAIVDICLK